MESGHLEGSRGNCLKTVLPKDNGSGGRDNLSGYGGKSSRGWRPIERPLEKNERISKPSAFRLTKSAKKKKRE